MNFGLKIKLARISKKEKQYEFANKLGITPQYLAKIENGQADIRLSLMKRIANELSCSIQELFFDEKEGK